MEIICYAIFFQCYAIEKMLIVLVVHEFHFTARRIVVVCVIIHVQ